MKLNAVKETRAGGGRNLQVSDHAGGDNGGAASHGGTLGVAMAILITDRGAHVGAALKSTENGGDKAKARDDRGNLHFDL